jgi:predicted transcriptional regulator
MTQIAEARPLISARVEPELAERFTRYARAQDRTVSSALREAMRAAIEREEKLRMAGSAA